MPDRGPYRIALVVGLVSLQDKRLPDLEFLHVVRPRADGRPLEGKQAVDGGYRVKPLGLQRRGDAVQRRRDDRAVRAGVEDAVDRVVLATRELDGLMRLLAVSGVRPQIDTVLPLSQAREGFERLAAGDVVGKVVLTA